MIGKVFKTVAWTALIVLILPSILFVSGRMELDEVKWIMLLATIGWFLFATIGSWQDNTDIAD